MTNHGPVIHPKCKHSKGHGQLGETSQDSQVGQGSSRLVILSVVCSPWRFLRPFQRLSEVKPIFTIMLTCCLLSSLILS